MAFADRLLINLVLFENFYQMDESDYTVMASDKDPATITVTV